MKTDSIQKLLLFAMLAGSLSMIYSCGSEGKKERANVVGTDTTMLCVGYHWTENEGREFLEKQRSSYTTAADWTKRAEQIRREILRGTGLEKFPEKCPLNPIFGDIRSYEGYQVQNVAFESLPGVFVTGSLYRPTDAGENLPGILNTHGHWANRDDYGRYRPDAQKRFAAMARMGAIV